MKLATGPSDVGLRNFPLTRNVWGSSDEIPMFYFNPPIRLHFLYGHEITYGRFKQVCIEKPRDSICIDVINFFNKTAAISKNTVRRTPMSDVSRTYSIMNDRKCKTLPFNGSKVEVIIFHIAVKPNFQQLLCSLKEMVVVTARTCHRRKPRKGSGSEKVNRQTYNGR